MQNISINRIKSFVDQFDNTCDDNRADRHYAADRRDTENQIRKDYAERAKKQLGKLSRAAKKLSGHPRKLAWKHFFNVKNKLVQQGILPPDREPLTEKKRAAYLRLGLHIRTSLKAARDHARFLITKGLAERCILAKDPKTGHFGIFTKNPPYKQDSIIEIILPPSRLDHDPNETNAWVRSAKPTTVTQSYANEDGTYTIQQYRATEMPVKVIHPTKPAPYRHGDKIQKSFTVSGYVDRYIADSYFEIQVRAFSAWGAELMVKEAAPEVTVEDVAEIASDWENQDFPADDTLTGIDSDDEASTNSLADLICPYHTAEEQYETICNSIDAAFDNGDYEEEDA